MPLESELEIVHPEISQKLQEIGWINGNEKYVVKENSLIEKYYIPEILEEKIKEINKDIFSKLKLTNAKEKQVFEQIHIELQNADEVRILEYLKYGVKVGINHETYIIKLIDDKSSVFFYLHEVKFKGSTENSKPDFTLFINGIPIIIIEAKSETIPYSNQKALEQIKKYEINSPDLFRFVQFGIVYGDDKFYIPTMPNWKKEKIELPVSRWIIRDKKGNRINNIFDLLNPKRIVEFIKYFIFYAKPKEGELKKLMARGNQYSATVKAINRIREYLENKKMNHGLIWHWQGSGKTYTMFFIANYFLNLYYSTNPLIFFVVDREDLENQHERVLKAVQDEKFKNLFKKVESINHLADIIKTIKESEMTENIIQRGIYLTTIQKFQKGKKEDTDELTEKEEEETEKELYSLIYRLGKSYLESLKDKDYEEYKKHEEKIKSLDKSEKEKYIINLGGVQRKNILFLIDEAHRSHYGLLGAMRKTCFPSSITLGFTGTPIFKDEKNTFIEFSYPEKGEYYLDVYFIEDSINDGFTLPIIYKIIKEGDIKAEGVRIKLTEDEIAGFIKEYMEKKGSIESLLDAKISEKDVSRYITKAKTILLNEKRIEKLADYISDRIKEDTEDFKFKAMIVAVNRVGCVKYKRILDNHLKKKFGEEASNWTEIVMTYNENDTDKDIVEYKEELINRKGNKDLKRINGEIQNDFLEKENPKILIVTDMLLTGFDAPILKVMYLDKPLYEHRLLQAIARVNRPYNGKEFGLIIDSFGLMEHLTKTMVIYNMLADENIKKDLEMNMVNAIDQKFNEFELKLKEIKERLKNLKVGTEEMGIDLELLKESFKRGVGKEEIKAKIATIAMFYMEEKEFSVVIIRLVNEIKGLLKLYSALGSYNQKIVYDEDIEALAYVYYKLKQILNGKGFDLKKEFWDEVQTYIHSKTAFENFKDVGKVELNPEEIKKLMENFTDEKDIRNTVIKAVADFFFNLRSILNEKRFDPIYKLILERLEKLRLEWITRIISTKAFIEKLETVKAELLDYNNKLYEKSDEEKIVETLRYYIKENIGKDIEFKNTKLIIKEVLESKLKMFTPVYEKNIKTALLKDILNLGIKEQEAKNVVEELAEYLKEEIDRIWRK